MPGKKDRKSEKLVSFYLRGSEIADCGKTVLCKKFGTGGSTTDGSQLRSHPRNVLST